MPLPHIHIPVHKMTNDVHGVIDSNYSQKTFLMHRLPILLIKKEVIESRVFIRGGYVNSALCVEGARIISVLQKNPACVIPLSL